MGKFKNFISNASAFLTGLNNFTTYMEDKKKTDQALADIASSIQEMKTDIKNIHAEQTKFSKEQTQITANIKNLKSALQLELFESLRVLKETYTAKGWASYEEKINAKMYYDKIHDLGLDGWSDACYNDIMAMPDSLAEKYKREIKARKIVNN